MYGMIFASTFDSTLMDQSVETRYLFFCLIALADEDGNVEMTRSALARRINLPRADLDEALEPLLGPDEESLSREHEGRRILPLESGRGWFVVNRKAYIEKARKLKKRSADRKRIAEKRATERDMSQGVASRRKASPKVAQPSQKVAHIDVDVDIDDSEEQSSSGRSLSTSQREMAQIAEIFKSGGIQLKGQSFGAWAKRLKQYREQLGRDPGFVALLRDLRACQPYLADKGASYVLKIISGAVRDGRCGKVRGPAQRHDPGLDTATRERARQLEEGS